MRYLACIALVAGCTTTDICAGSPGACVNLTIASMTAKTLDSVRVTASGAVDGSQLVMANKMISLPADVPVSLPKGAGGALSLFVEGILDSNVVASGEADLNVNVDEHSHSTVDIEPIVMMMPPPDLAGVVGMPDLSFPVDTACADYAHARCARVAACSSGAPTYLSRTWGDQSTCEQREKLSCLTEAGAPGTGFDAAFVEHCAAFFSQQSCADRFAGYRPLACITSGSRMKGQGCVYDTQCSTSFCRIQANTACGSCDTAPAPGAMCTTNADCGARQTCAMGLCQVPGILTAACSTAKPCGEELACINGVCKQDGASAGAACDGSNVNQPGCDFDIGLYCSSGTGGTCAAGSTATLANPQCGVINNVRIFCTNGADCWSGTCKPPSADGAACDATNGPTCRAPAKCVQSVCRLPAPNTCT